MFRVPSRPDYERAILFRAKVNNEGNRIYQTPLGYAALEKDMHGVYQVTWAEDGLVEKFDEVLCRKFLAAHTNETGWL